MPWKPSDASKHKKGLSESQKKKWAKIANEVLEQCQKDNGKDCEAKAIRVANSRVGNKKNSEEDTSMGKKMLRIPKGGYKFTSDEALLEFKDKDDDGKPKTFSMEAYTGGIMPDIFGGSIAVDISGVNFMGKKRFPILEQHDWDKKIGVANSVPSTENNKIFFDKINVLNNDTAQEFSSNLADGFPYQASISVKPLKIEEVPDGESVDVNGTKLKGPGIIIRTSQFREASVCVFGRDNNTKVASLSDDGSFDDVEVEVVNFTDDNNAAPSGKNTDGGQNMDWDQIKKDYPELYKKFKEAWDEKDTQITEKDQQIASLTQERDDLKQKVDNFSNQEKKYEQRIAALEKADQLRKEKEISDNASNIADAQLKASDVPARLYDKVKKQVNHNDFVDQESGEFDAQKFTDAVKAEIKEWSEAINASATGSTIMGAGGTGNVGVDGGDPNQKYQDLADTMAQFAGVEESKQQ